MELLRREVLSKYYKKYNILRYNHNAFSVKGEEVSIYYYILVYTYLTLKY
jgi:hypothetical protein